MSDTIFYPKQFRIRNPIRQSLPKTPSDRIVYPKPFRIKNPIRRGFLKKTLSDRISYLKPFRIENPIRIGRRMKSRILDPTSLILDRILHRIDWSTVELAHSQFAVVALSNQGLGICKQIGQLVNKLVKLGILVCNKMSDVPATE